MEYKIDKEGRVAFRGRLGPIRPEPGRKYWNHMAKHSPGEWRRHWLLTSGQYIKTSNPDMRKGYGWAMVGESGPEFGRSDFYPSRPFR